MIVSSAAPGLTILLKSQTTIQEKKGWDSGGRFSFTSFPKSVGCPLPHLSLPAVCICESCWKWHLSPTAWPVKYSGR